MGVAGAGIIHSLQYTGNVLQSKHRKAYLVPCSGSGTIALQTALASSAGVTVQRSAIQWEQFHFSGGPRALRTACMMELRASLY
jgi:hypothetical protein